MNERIRELALQAKQSALDAMIKITDKEQALKIYSELYDTKFAELIIQECMQACINMGNEYEIKSAGQYQAEMFAFAIKKHFGVTE